MNSMMDTMAEMKGGPMPQALEAKAQEADDKEGQLLTDSAPMGSFHVQALNSVVTALNRVLPLFKMEPYAPVSEDMEVLPPDFFKLLVMVDHAASDAGAMSLDLGKVKTDRDLTMLAGKLGALAKDRDFKDFLNAPSARKEAPVPTPSSSKAPEPSDSELDSLFASRMGG